MPTDSDRMFKKELDTHWKEQEPEYGVTKAKPN